MLFIALNKKDPLPAYRQIARRIEELIETRAIGDGEILPATRRLARQLSVSRYTVCCAYQELWARGFLVSTPGSYTRVRARAAYARDGSSGRGAPVTGPTEGLIDLGAYRLDESLFPMRDLRRALLRVSGEENAGLLHHGDPHGYLPLRATIAARLCSHSIPAGRRTFSSPTARCMAWTWPFACSPARAGRSSWRSPPTRAPLR